MAGKTNLLELIKTMQPKLNDGDYVFTSVANSNDIDREITICEFKEREGVTVVLEKAVADKLNLSYDYIASWITLQVYSSLSAVGLTAVFSKALADNSISCNVIAGYYHDHIFVAKTQARKAIDVLSNLAKNYKG